MLGHLGGDFVLKELAARLKALSGATNCWPAYGGEEFAVVLPEAAQLRSSPVADRLRRSSRTNRLSNEA